MTVRVATSQVDTSKSILATLFPFYMHVLASHFFITLMMEKAKVNTVKKEDFCLPEMKKAENLDFRTGDSVRNFFSIPNSP